MIISVFNQKGGVAKTTTTTNLAAGLAMKGKSVLVVDFDPQANATNALGIDDEQLDGSVYDLLQELISKKQPMTQARIKEYIQQTSFGIDILPSDINLADAEQTLSSTVSRELLLHKLLLLAKGDYDYVIIDCPPSVGLLSINALAASDRVLIPLSPSYFSVKGLKQLLRTYGMIRDNIKPDLEIMGVLVTKYDQRITKHKEIREQLESLPAFEGRVFKTAIRVNAEIEYAQDSQQPITAYNTKCNGYDDYMSLTKEVLNYGN